MIQAIFFDLDGVLINSEKMHQQLFKEYLEETNSTIPPERLNYLIGSHKSLDPWDKILDGIKLKDTKEEFKIKFKKAHQEKLKLVDYSTLAFEETAIVLKKLKEKKIKLAVASSSNYKYIYEVLNSNKLVSFFDLILSCDDFASSKPAPDIYQYCKKYFGYKNNNCLVIEDSPIGIQAGKNANIKVVARKDNLFNLDQSNADFFINNLNELFDIIIYLNSQQGAVTKR